MREAGEEQRAVWERRLEMLQGLQEANMGKLTQAIRADRSLTREYTQWVNESRMDLVAVDLFAEDRNCEEAYMDLFWQVWQPRPASFELPSPPLPWEAREFWRPWAKPLEPLPDDIEEALLDRLADFERAARVPYQADATDSGDFFSSGLRYVHVGAARALRLKRRVGYTDDVRWVLTEVSRVLQRLELIIRRNEDSRQVWTVNGDSMYTVSAFAVGGLILSELFSVKRLDGAYEEALHLAAQALGHFAIAEACFGGDISIEAHLFLLQIQLARGSEVEEAWEDFERTEWWHLKWQGYQPLLKMNPQEIVDAFEALRERDGSDAWKQVAEDCRTLADLWESCDGDPHEMVRDIQGTEWSWLGYWHRALGWTGSRLSPNELLDYLQVLKAHEAEARLRHYFFGELWTQVPRRAQQHLINADLLWSSPQQVEPGSVLNQLQIAGENMCHELLWVPLQQTQGGVDLLEFAQRNAELGEQGRFPTLREYAWVCRRPFFRELLRSRKLAPEEERFLTHDLPRVLDNLRKARDLAQHDPTRTWQREDVAPHFNRFLGIGQQGVLPELARLAGKLQDKRGPTRP